MKKINKLLLVLVFLIFVMPVINIKGEDNQQKIDDLKAQIEQKVDELEKEQTDLDNLEKKITKLEKEQKQIINDKEKLEKKIGDLEVLLSDYLLVAQKNVNTKLVLRYINDEEDFFNAMFNVNKLNNFISSKFSALVNGLEELETKNNKYNQNIEQLKVDADQRKVKIDKLEKTYTTLNEELVKLEGLDDYNLKESANAFIPQDEQEEIMRKAGLSPVDYNYADFIITKESGWNYTATNPVSSAYGLCQSLPGSKMASAGSDWKDNPVTQMRWCDGYATSRYGSWEGAYDFWQKNNWW